MRISTKVRYGLKAIAYIAENSKDGQFVRIKEISEVQDTSSQYLEQILFKLKNEGIIEGKRGPYGGYKMIKIPQDITLYEIYKILDDEGRVINCNEGEVKGANCKDDTCNDNCIWSKMDTAIKKILEETTLEDFIRNREII
ncbi:MAG: Rrf2 family transcriptional regulator [Fusobacteriaceae bacterium]|jgi:Rrf2 family protein|nr:Rrf2 family transcriptional regulator [Fusobacteriaceae bacterium]